MLQLVQRSGTNDGRGNARLIFDPERRQLGWGDRMILRQADQLIADFNARLGNSFGINAAAPSAARTGPATRSPGA